MHAQADIIAVQPRADSRGETRSHDDGALPETTRYGGLEGARRWLVTPVIAASSRASTSALRRRGAILAHSRRRASSPDLPMANGNDGAARPRRSISLLLPMLGSTCEVVPAATYYAPLTTRGFAQHWCLTTCRLPPPGSPPTAAGRPTKQLCALLWTLERALPRAATSTRPPRTADELSTATPLTSRARSVSGGGRPPTSSGRVPPKSLVAAPHTPSQRASPSMPPGLLWNAASPRQAHRATAGAPPRATFCRKRCSLPCCSSL